MKTLAVFAVVIVAAAAVDPINLWRSLATDNGQFVLTKDYSLEDGVEYSVKYVKPYKVGQPLPLFRYDIDSSEELLYFLASEQGQKGGSWTDRVRKLRQVLNTGIDVSDESFFLHAAFGISNLPADRQYYVDSSGEIYYEGDIQNQLKPI